MDLQTELTFKEQMREDPRQFLPLFDENFPSLYRYVSRRVQDENIKEQIVRLSLLDAVGQIQTCPKDTSFLVWVYLIARGRIQEYVKGGISGPGATLESPIFDGASMVDGVYDDEYKLKQQAETFFSALTFEEREIIRLKFFEELMDGEVMYVLGMQGGTIGPKIYQVLKRGYEILFGKVDDYTGVYYGELHGFLSRLKNIEKIPVPETFKLKLKAELLNKLDKMYFEKFSKEPKRDEEGRESKREERTPVDPFSVGSKDPAKTFVYAAKGLSKEEIDQITQEYMVKKASGKVSGKSTKEKAQRIQDDTAHNAEDIWEEQFGKSTIGDVETVSGDAGIVEDFGVIEDVPIHFTEDSWQSAFAEKIYDFWDKWRGAFSIILSSVFVISVIGVSVVLFFSGNFIDHGVTGLSFPVVYKTGFELTDTENPKDTSDYALKARIENNLISKIAKDKKVGMAEVSMKDSSDDGQGDGQVLNMNFRIENDGNLQYVFDVRKNGAFRVKSFKEVGK